MGWGGRQNKIQLSRVDNLLSVYVREKKKTVALKKAYQLLFCIIVIYV